MVVVEPVSREDGGSSPPAVNQRVGYIYKRFVNRHFVNVKLFVRSTSSPSSNERRAFYETISISNFDQRLKKKRRKENQRTQSDKIDNTKIRLISIDKSILRETMLLTNVELLHNPEYLHTSEGNYRRQCVAAPRRRLHPYWTQKKKNTILDS